MEYSVKHFVEEYWIDNSLGGFVKEIESREKYLNKIEKDSCLVLFRFFDREFIKNNGKEYIGDPINYTYFYRMTNDNNFIGFDNESLLNSHVYVEDKYGKAREVIIDNIVSILDNFDKENIRKK